MIKTYKLSGMTCGGCKKTVENILKNAEGVSVVEANVSEGNVRIESDGPVSFEDLKKVLADFDQYSIEDL